MYFTVRTYKTAEVQFSHLCPLCDQPIGPRRIELFDNLPKTKLSTLPDLYRSIWPHTVPVPRESNENGRKVSGKTRCVFEVDVVCKQHRYESLILPLAAQFDWPRTLDCASLRGRLDSNAVAEELVRVYINPQQTVLNKERVVPGTETTSRKMSDIMEVVDWGRTPPRVCG